METVPGGSMPERSDLDRRLRAVERALTDGDQDLARLEDTAAITARIDELETRLEDLEDRLSELDAATQAVRGYVGNVRSVNDAVEQRADAALAAVDRLEARLEENHGGKLSKDRSTGTAHGRSSREPMERAGSSRQEPSQPPRTEMSPPGTDTVTSAEDDRNEERSVIDRVREAL